ncbi:MAG: alpha/beta hydrolase [Cyclobacteriaceae bacterium]|nr:alpha/beta hydrolase [Cyclobacteriaceae bacterium]
MQEKYRSDQIIIYGRSLGTGIATRLASQVAAKVLILETPYDNFSEMMQERLCLLPIKKVINYSFNSIDCILEVKYPIHIFHGTLDNIIPLKFGKMLANAANPDLINFNTIEGGEHNNLVEFESYNKAMAIILAEN